MDANTFALPHQSIFQTVLRLRDYILYVDIFHLFAMMYYTWPSGIYTKSFLSRKVSIFTFANTHTNEKKSITKMWLLILIIKSMKELFSIHLLTLNHVFPFNTSIFVFNISIEQLFFLLLISELSMGEKNQEWHLKTFCTFCCAFVLDATKGVDNDQPTIKMK